MTTNPDTLNFKPGAQPYNWWSHRPVLSALLDLLPLRSALELGMGEGSTPMLYSRVPRLVSVESNATHLANTLARHGPRDGFTPVHHPLMDPRTGEGVRYGAMPWELPDEVRESAREFYRRLGRDHAPFDLVLVDQYAGVRDVSLDELLDHSAVLVLHDAEHCTQPPDHPNHDCYWYNRFYARHDLSGFEFFRFDALSVHADILVRRCLNLDPIHFSNELNARTAEFHAAFAGSERPSPRYRADYRADLCTSRVPVQQIASAAA